LNDGLPSQRLLQFSVGLLESYGRSVMKFDHPGGESFLTRDLF
jgi:hypothetical protein